MTKHFTHDGLPILTEHVCPPIPRACRMDWAAWIDGEEEFGCGHGDSEEEAIDHLKERWRWRTEVFEILKLEEDEAADEIFGRN